MNDVYEMAQGQFTKVIAVRLKPGADLLEGLEMAAKEAGISNGVIVSGIGSLRTARYCNVEPLEGSPAGYGYSSVIEEEGTIELTGMSGLICHDPDGEVNLHVHITMSHIPGDGIAGHLCPGTTVLVTADVVIAEVGEGIEMLRDFDESLGFPIFKPVQK